MCSYACTYVNLCDFPLKLMGVCSPSDNTERYTVHFSVLTSTECMLQVSVLFC